MLTRRAMLSGLMCLAAAPALANTGGSRKVAAKPRGRIDAVIDISHSTVVRDFTLAREKSHILGVIHKASEGGDWRDPAYAQRRAQAEKAGLLWGAYHFGTHQYPGAAQAAMFLATAKPGPTTLIALDLELNELNPGNSMTLHQAEEFVHAVFAATGRYPLIYTNAAWAEGKPAGRGGHSLRGRIGPHSILAQCPLWLGDYRTEPEVPTAWKGKGWHFWQYAGDTEDGGPREARVRGVWGIERCDRNLFRGDAVALGRFWKQEAGRPASRLVRRG
ncbi:glycoside hydrolase family 25 protein [Phaeospirillum tilakii]|uniref:Glycoside hydrolase family 25 protein n=1 Tax=Phaeospirillum tilakii TaxID=741673 RepID=A0ABW5CCT9_9PROT